MRAPLALGLLALSPLGCGARTALRDPIDAASDVPPPVDAPARGCAATTRRWSVVPSPTSADLTGVFAVAADDVWIAAADSSLYRYDGARWNAVAQVVPEAAASLWFASRDDGWAVTRSWVLRWDGRRWSVMDPLQVPPPQVLSAVWGSAPRDFWIGGGMASPQIQVLAHFDGTRFTRVEGPAPLGIQVVGFTGTAPDDVWAVGHLGRLAHLQGELWATVETPSEGTITACASVGRADVWCSALRGHAHHITPGRIETERVGGDETYHYAIWHAGGGELWSVGYRGAAAHRINGRWSTPSLPTHATLAAIHGRCPTDAWAVGEGGAILRLTP